MKKNSFIVLFVIIAMTFMATLDSSIVNVALPVLATKLNVPLGSIEWVIASYSIVICATLLFFGRMGDIIGKSNVFQFGTVLFTIASMLCGLSRTLTELIICRCLQGIGASAYMANNHGIITELYPKEKRGKALGILVTAVALGNMMGPSVGGIVLSVFSWNVIFLINVPIGIIVFLIGIKFLPDNKRNSERMDKVGAFLQFLGTTLLFGSFIMAQQAGFSDPYILTGILLSIFFLVCFFLFERKQEMPLLNFTIFQNVQFSFNLACALILFVCIAASSILLPFYLQDTLKLSPMQAGMFMMLAPFVLGVFSPVFGSISDKIKPERIILVGLTVMGGGFFLMSTLSNRSFIPVCAIFVSTIALGQALFQPANNSLIMSSCPKDKLGIAGSINSLVRNLGQILGITFSTTLLYYFMSDKEGYRVFDYIYGKDDVFLYGMKHVYIILAALCLLGVLITGFKMWGMDKKTKKPT